MSESDISTLIKISQDEEIQKFYFIDTKSNMEDYCKVYLIESKNPNKYLRLWYCLPIETDNTIKRLISLYTRLSTKYLIQINYKDLFLN